MLEARGVELNITLDYSYVAFKMDNTDEQGILDTKKITLGELILAPFMPENVIS